MIVNGPDNKQYDIPDDATDSEILGLFGGSAAQSKPQATKSNGFAGLDTISAHSPTRFKNSASRQEVMGIASPAARAQAQQVKKPLRAFAESIPVGAAKIADTAAALVGSLAEDKENSLATKIQRNITEPAIQYWNEQKTPSPLPTIGENVGASLGELAPTMALGPAALPVMAATSTYQTGKDLVDAGIPLEVAQKASMLQGGGAAAMGAIPGAAPTVGKTALLALANPVTGIAQRAATREFLKPYNKEVAEGFDPLDPASLIMDVAMAGPGIMSHFPMKAEAKAKAEALSRPADPFVKPTEPTMAEPDTTQPPKTDFTQPQSEQQSAQQKAEPAQPEPPAQPSSAPLEYTSNNVPVDPNRVNFEVGLVKNPNTSKTAVLLPPETTGPQALQIAKNAGLRALKQGEELYLFDPKQISEYTLRKQVKEGKNGLALGYGTESVPENGIPYAVDLNGHGTLDVNEIISLRDASRLGFSGVAPDVKSAITKIQEMGRSDAEIRGVPLDAINQKGEPALDTEPRETEVAPYEKTLYRGEADREALHAGGMGRGKYYTSEESIAKSYAEDFSDVPGQVKSEAVKLEKPFYAETLDDVFAVLSESEQNIFTPNEGESIEDLGQRQQDRITEILKSQGYDGIVLKTSLDPRTNEYVSADEVVVFDKGGDTNGKEKGWQRREVLGEVTPDAPRMAESVPGAETFNRLSPNGKRGSAEAFTVNISPSKLQSLAEIRQEISDGEAGKRIATNMEQNATGSKEQVSWGSTFPEYFQNKNLTKKQVLPILDRILKGESVTEAQWLMAEDMLQAKRYDTLNKILSDRAKKYAESETSISNLSDEDLARANQMADDFFAQFGGDNETTASVAGDVRQDAAREAEGSVATSGGEARVGEAATTERIDESGWGQQVAPEIQGDKKPLQFGDKKPTGRNVGLSEFTDGFTPDPQQNIFSTPSSGGKSHADAGGYAERTPPIRETTQTFIELPEMLKLAKMINDGKLPKLVERMGKALGRFIGDGDGNALIKLRKDLFAGPQIASESFKSKDAMGKWEEWQQAVKSDNPDADIIFRQKYNKNTGNVDFKAYKRDPNYVLKVFSHEIGHNADYLKDHIVFGRGNIFGHVAALKKYMKDTLAMYPNAKGEALTKADKERFATQAKTELGSGEDIVETITREVPKYAEAGVTPEMITEIWNGMDSAREKNPDLYKFIAKMSDSEKKQVVVQAMKGVVHESLKRLGRVQVGTETITETVTRKATVSPEAIKRRADQLIKEEIMKRRLYEKDVVMDELKALTQIWKPFDDTANAKYTKYRYSPAELYADATSVLFNEPQLLKDTAPTFYKSFFYYMGERPQFQEAYKAISRLSKDPQALGADRYAEEMAMYERGNAKMEEIRKNQKPGEKLYDTMMRWFIDKNHDVLKDLPNTPDGKKARYMLEEIPYIAGEAENYVRKAHDIRLNVEAEGATIDDLSAYMLAKHIIANRSDIANTGGKTAATEQAKLDWMRQNMGERKFAVLEQAAEQFKEVRQHVITRMEDSGIVTPDMLKRIKENPEYAHIEVQKYLDNKYGNGTAEGAGWKKMAEGTLEDVTNVYTATVLQDISIMRMAKINEAKSAITDVFDQTGLAKVAPMKYSPAEKGMRPDKSKVERDQALLTVLKDGKPVHYIVDKHVADMYQYDPVKAMDIGKIAGFITTYYRDILVSKNPAWMARNLYRDFKGTVKNNPEIAWWSPMDRLKLLKAYKQAFKESRADVFHNQRSADIEMMHNEHMLNADRMYSNLDESFDDPLIRMALEFNFGSQEPANAALAKLKKAYIYADKMGKVSEQTSKIAGMKFLRDKGLSGDDLAHRVRTRIGTPDYKRQGSLQQLTNNIFLFSNVNKEGMRSAYEAFREDPISYSFKTIESNVLPKLLLVAAAGGIFGDELKKLVDSIPSWVKRSSNVIPIPQAMTDMARSMGLAGKDDVGYIKLPSDYEGQFFGSLVYDMATSNLKGVTEDVKGMIPYYPSKAHPFLKLAYDYGEYVAGRSPYDSFRQKDVLTKEQQKYLEVEGPQNSKSLTGMGKHTWNMAGLGNVYQPDNKEFPKQKAKEEAAFKQIMRYMGGFIEFSDAGKQENMIKPMIEERNQKAIKSYEVGDVINESIRAGKNKPADMVGVYKSLIAEGKVDPVKTKFGAFRSRYMKSLAQEKYGIKPQSKKEEAVLKRGFEQSE